MAEYRFRLIGWQRKTLETHQLNSRLVSSGEGCHRTGMDLKTGSGVSAGQIKNAHPHSTLIKLRISPPEPPDMARMGLLSIPALNMITI